MVHRSLSQAQSQRKPSLLGPANALLCGLGLALALSTPTVHADSWAGSETYQFLLSGVPTGSTVLDIGHLLPAGQGASFASIRATFTADVHPAAYNMFNVGDYQLAFSSSATFQDPARYCYNYPVASCIFHWNFYTRQSAHQLVDNDDSWMRIRIGTVGGQDDNFHTATEKTYTRQDRIDDGTQITQSIDEGTNSFVQVSNSYETIYTEERISRTKSTLSVILDLDAATLADISSTGLLSFSQQYGSLMNTSLRLDYVAVSAVPELGSGTLAITGLAAFAALQRRRRPA